MNAGQQREALWQRVCDSPYRDRLPEQEPEELVQGLARTPDKNEFLTEALSHRSDVVPASRLDPLLPRPKIFHGCGTVAKVALRITHEGYSGLLATGALGLLRASTTHSRVVSPGIGLKLFVDDAETRNLVAMVRLEGLGKRAGFFDEPLTTSIPRPHVRELRFPFEQFYQWVALAAVFDGAMAWLYTAEEEPPSPLVIPLHEVAGIRRDGTPVADPDHPPHLKLVPSDPVRAACPGDRDFRHELAELQAGQDLYEVMDHLDRPIGTLHLESEFVASVFGDQQLFFRHPLPIR